MGRRENYSEVAFRLRLNEHLRNVRLAIERVDKDEACNLIPISDGFGFSGGFAVWDCDDSARIQRARAAVRPGICDSLQDQNYCDAGSGAKREESCRRYARDIDGSA